MYVKKSVQLSLFFSFFLILPIAAAEPIDRKKMKKFHLFLCLSYNYTNSLLTACTSTTTASILICENLQIVFFIEAMLLMAKDQDEGFDRMKGFLLPLSLLSL